jgi:hypothetical protein
MNPNFRDCSLLGFVFDLSQPTGCISPVNLSWPLARAEDAATFLWVTVTARHGSQAISARNTLTKSCICWRVV